MGGETKIFKKVEGKPSQGVGTLKKGEGAGTPLRTDSDSTKLFGLTLALNKSFSFH